jgi:hypothetical protein
MRPMATRRILSLVLPIAATSLALAACGGSESTAGSGDDRAQFREAALKFAECMRRNGVDVPDPSPGGNGGVLMVAPRSGADQPAFRRAEEECRKHMEDVRPPELSEEEQREFRERALKHARCMREHGIDMPDPTFGEGGSVQMKLDGGVDPRDPAFQEAQKACARFGPTIEEGS